MKRPTFLLLGLLLCATCPLLAQNVGINTTNPRVSLEVAGSDAVQLPAGTTGQRPAPADVDAGAVRFNTSLNSLEYYDGADWVSLVPPGTIVAYAGFAPPQGWLLCDGSAVAIADYPALFGAIATVWGDPGGGQFNLPDLRGRFLRGVDAGAGQDPDAAARAASAPGGNTGDDIGTVQAAALGSHTHTATDAGHTHSVDPPNTAMAINDPGHAHAVDPPNSGVAINDPGHGHGLSAAGNPIGQYGGPGGAASGGFAGGGLYGPWVGYANLGVVANTTGITAAVNIAPFASAGSTTGITGAVNVPAFNSASGTANISVGSAGGSETRPTNASVFYIIKY